MTAQNKAKRFALLVNIVTIAINPNYATVTAKTATLPIARTIRIILKTKGNKYNDTIHLRFHSL